MKKFGSKIATVNEYQVPTHYLIVQSRPLIVILPLILPMYYRTNVLLVLSTDLIITLMMNIQ